MNITTNALLFCTVLCASSFSLAEQKSIAPAVEPVVENEPSEIHSMKEMSDESLAELEAKAGITIDMEFRYSIGEIAWLDSDDPEAGQKPTAITPTPTRYVPPVVVNGGKE